MIMLVKFSSETYFLTSLKSQTQDPWLKVPPGELLYPDKIHQPQPYLKL